MDTSIPTQTGDRVFNIGLLSMQKNFVILGIGLFIAGVIFIALGGSKTHTIIVSSDKYDAKSCPRCKESIKGDALVCHFCNFELPFLDATVRDHILRIKSLVADGLSNDEIADQLNSQGINCLINKGLWNADLIGNIRSDFAL